MPRGPGGSIKPAPVPSTDRRSRDSRLCEWIRWEVAFGTRLSPGANQALVFIVGFVSAHTGHAEIAYAELAQLMRVSPRQAQRRVAELLRHPRTPIRCEERGGHRPCRFHLTEALLEAPNFLVELNRARDDRNDVSRSGRHDIRGRPGTTLRAPRHDIFRSAYKEQPGELPGGTRSRIATVVSRPGDGAGDDDGWDEPLDGEGAGTSASTATSDEDDCGCVPYVSAVLELYCQLPGTRAEPTRSDRETATRWWERDIPIDAVRVGLLQAAVHRECRTRDEPLAPVNSLKYFQDAVEEARTSPPENGYAGYLAAKLAPHMKPTSKGVP